MECKENRTNAGVQRALAQSIYAPLRRDMLRDGTRIFFPAPDLQIEKSWVSLRGSRLAIRLDSRRVRTGDG
jgi:hypothetical protein